MSNLLEFFEHHAWANQRLIDYCGRLPKELLEASAPGTRGSVIDTLRHLVGAEERYLAFMEDRPRRPEVMEKGKPHLATMRRTCAEHAESWRRLLTTEPDPKAVITRKWPNGTPDRLTTRTLVVQAIHHGNDHRTHICTVLGAQGRRPPILDAWHFYGEE